MTTTRTGSKTENRGGPRPGAGRPSLYNEGAHSRRPDIDCRRPLHVTLRLRDGLVSLRTRDTFRQIKLIVAHVRSFGLRIIHYSVLKNHIHLIVEVDQRSQLQSGMMSFNGRLGRLLRRHPSFDAKKFRRGLFTSRYHQKSIQTARQMKNTLAYVLLNAAKHFKRVAYIDEFSSGIHFIKWRELLGPRFDGLILAQVLSLESIGWKSILSEVSSAQTWLCRAGWRTSKNFSSLPQNARLT